MGKVPDCQYLIRLSWPIGDSKSYLQTALACLAAAEHFAHLAERDGSGQWRQQDSVRRRVSFLIGSRANGRNQYLKVRADQVMSVQPVEL
jgi:hypothetical protein